MTNPAGLTVNLNGRTAAAPFVRTLVVGSVNTIGVASPQTLGTSSYVFNSWSDGGAQSHLITVPTTAVTYTATFAAGPTTLPGLVAAYGFEETTGSMAADSSGNNLNGVVTGATRVAAGRHGRALSFDGLNDWVTVADHNLLDLTTGLTIEAWVRPAVASTDWTTIALKERGTNGLAYSLYAADGGGRPPATYINRNGSDIATAGPSALPLNTWTHVTGTYDGANLRLYVNGTQVAFRAESGPVSTSNNPLRLGGNGVWGEFFNGLIDEVRIYDRALSPAEIAIDMNSPVGGSGGGFQAAAPTGTGGSGRMSAGAVSGLQGAAVDLRGHSGEGLLPTVSFNQILPGLALGQMARIDQRPIDAKADERRTDRVRAMFRHLSVERVPANRDPGKSLVVSDGTGSVATVSVPLQPDMGFSEVR